MESRVNQAIESFKNGYNCAQAVFATYSDLFGLDKELALKIASSFGGGIGGMREVCGTVSGMAMVAGLFNGTFQPNDKEGKKMNYHTVQLLSDEFKNENGSIICKQLLGLEPGLPEGKEKKPCAEYVRMCSMLIEKHLLQ
jgi:C_GCAxxG_C_C family probable redox protein